MKLNMKEKSAEKSSAKITETIFITFSDGSEQIFNSNSYRWTFMPNYLEIKPEPERPQGLQRILFPRGALSKVVIQNAKE